MNAVAIGPLMFSGDRLAAILSIATFMLVSTILSARVDRRIRHWSTQALIVGLVAARLGHVALHADSFLAEPWRVIAVWQGGFSMSTGLATAVFVTAFYLRPLRTGLAAAFTLGLSLFVWIVTLQLTAATAGQPAPTLAFQQLDGAPLAFADTGGKPVVVNIWATWCPPCRREMPLLAEVAASRSDVTFLFANQGEGPDQIKSFLATQKLALTHVLLDQGLSLPRHYGTPGIPVTLFLRRDGTLMTAHLGEISREALNDNIARLQEAP
ncbi:prolipoprotein diacylglyceryl transferase family protein [Ferrovibrio xuzhouensis]|uniref:Prolipoprotein diacylglyceryl transferase family protein n=1 Tax=Ferrovibrio xuzhouensis TaxID=1576914 RepID=A0ABV7VJE0_9PROT